MMHLSKENKIFFWRREQIEHQRGSVLLEVLVSLGVFALASTAVIVTTFGSQVVAVDAELNSEALLKAIEHIEDARAEAAGGLAGVIPATTKEEIYTVALIPEDTQTPLRKKITSKVSWQGEHGRFQEINLVSYLTKLLFDFGACESGTWSGDWSNPQELQKIYFPVSVSGTDIEAAYPYLFISASDSNTSAPKLFVYKVGPTDADAPQLLASFPINGAAIHALALRGQYLYAATSVNDEELMVFNVSVPEAAYNVVSVDLPGLTNARSLGFFDNTLVVGRDKMNPGDELLFFDISNPELPSQIASFTFNNIINGIVVAGKYLFVTSKSGEDLSLFDISNTQHPTYLTSTSTPGTVKLGSVGYQPPHYLFVGHKNPKSLLVLNFEDPNNIFIESDINIGGNIHGISCTVGNLLFLATAIENKELSIFDISDPAHPDEIAQLGITDMSPRDIAFANNRIFMVTDKGFVVFGPGP